MRRRLTRQACAETSSQPPANRGLFRPVDPADPIVHLRRRSRLRPKGGWEKIQGLATGKPDCRTPSPMRRSVALRRRWNSQGRSKMNDSLPELGDLEREVMQLVWANAPVTAEAVREQLSRPLKESTVRTVLRRLEDKGYTTHTVDGRTFVYHAAEPRGRVAAKAVQRVVDWFCNGSVEEVLVGMVDSAMLDQRQLRMLADKVAKAKASEKANEKASEKAKDKAKGGKK